MMTAMEWFFALFAALLGYAFAGYPALLWLFRRTAPQLPELNAFPRVTLVIPAHNEAVVLQAKLQNALAIDYPANQLEIVVASDGSVDATVAIAQGFAPRVTTLAFPQRRGKASVVNDAVAHATGTLICLCDANVLFRPDAVRRLVARLQDPHIGAATGQVRLHSEQANFGQGESAYYSVERQLQESESEWGSVMGVDGGLYLLRRELFQALPADTILDDFAISMLVLRQGQRVVYEPTAIAEENGTPQAAQEFRRRARVAAGAVQCLCRGHYPLLTRPGELFQFVSHKLLRWLSPLVWLALLAINICLLFQTHTTLPAGLYALALLGQCSLLALGLLGALSLPVRNTRLGGIVFYFVMSQVAMLSGLFKGLFNLQQVTWRQAERTLPCAQSQ